MRTAESHSARESITQEAPAGQGHCEAFERSRVRDAPGAPHCSRGSKFAPAQRIPQVRLSIPHCVPKLTPYSASASRFKSASHSAPAPRIEVASRGTSRRTRAFASHSESALTSRLKSAPLSASRRIRASAPHSESVFTRPVALPAHPSRASRPSAAAIAAAQRSGPAPCCKISPGLRGGQQREEGHRGDSRNPPDFRRPIRAHRSASPAAISPKPQHAEPILRLRILSPTAPARRLNGLRQVGNVENLVLIHILKAVLRLSDLEKNSSSVKAFHPRLRPPRRSGFGRRPGKRDGHYRRGARTANRRLRMRGRLGPTRGTALDDGTGHHVALFIFSVRIPLLVAPFGQHALVVDHNSLPPEPHPVGPPAQHPHDKIHGHARQKSQTRTPAAASSAATATSAATARRPPD